MARVNRASSLVTKGGSAIHYLAVFIFLSLCIMGLTTLGERVAHRLRERRTLLAGAWGVAWPGSSTSTCGRAGTPAPLRYGWVGVTLTGVALGGTALLLLALFGFFVCLYRKFNDQAEHLEHAEGGAQVARLQGRLTGRQRGSDVAQAANEAVRVPWTAPEGERTVAGQACSPLRVRRPAERGRSTPLGSCTW